MKKSTQLIVGIILIVMIILMKITNTDAQRVSLSLKEAVAMAVVANPEIKASQKEVERAQQQKVIARSLFLPTVGGFASLNHYFQLNPFFGFGETVQTDRVPYGRFGGPDQLTGGLTAIQPLYNPAAFPALKQARLSEQQSRIALKSREVEILLDVKQTYLQVLVLDERIKLQHERIRRNRQALLDSRVLLTQGKGLRVDTLRAYTAVRNLEPELLKLSYASETSRLRLRTLLGVDSLLEIQPSDSLSFPDPETSPSESEVYKAAMQRNPNLQLYRINENITDQQIRQANSSRLPVVSFAGQYQIQSQVRNFDYSGGNYPSSSYAGLQVIVPLFTGFANQAKSRQASMVHEQSQFHLRNVTAGLAYQVHAAVSNNKESLERLRTTASVKETAAMSYTIIQYRYEKGISSRLELTDAELALSTAQSNYLEAVYDYLVAGLVVEALMGSSYGE